MASVLVVGGVSLSSQKFNRLFHLIFKLNSFGQHFDPNEWHKMRLTEDQNLTADDDTELGLSWLRNASYFKKARNFHWTHMSHKFQKKGNQQRQPIFFASRFSTKWARRIKFRIQLFFGQTWKRFERNKASEELATIDSNLQLVGFCLVGSVNWLGQHTWSTLVVAPTVFVVFSNKTAPNHQVFIIVAATQID